MEQELGVDVVKSTKKEDEVVVGAQAAELDALEGQATDEGMRADHEEQQDNITEGVED